MGAGAWGTALAVHAHNAGNEVKLWAFLEEEKQDILSNGENTSRLPGVSVPSSIEVSNDLAIARDADYLLIVTPAQVIRKFLTELKTHLSLKTRLVFCSKGIEIASGDLLSEIADQALPEHEIGFLSGPNFAKEIALGNPGATSVAFTNLATAQDFAGAFSSQTLRVYANDDPIGVQIGGAYKNVLAIAAGMLKGAGYGENALAALVTRGLNEMTRFALSQGAKPSTTMGMSGVGDLMLCCYSTTSRNMKLGYDLGTGALDLSRDAQDDSNKPLTEGAFTVKALHKLAARLELDLPICEGVYQVLFAGQSIEDIAEQLLARPIPDLELNFLNKTQEA